MPKPKIQTQEIKAQERRAFIMDLRKSGVTYQRIADAVNSRFKPDQIPKNYDARNAYQDVSRELDKLKKEVSESAEEIKTMEMERLTNLWFAHFQKAKKGAEKATDLCLKVHDRIMRLHGLEITKQEITGKDGGPVEFLSDAEILKRIKELEKG